jgi:predicted Zn-dependent peptidase
VFRDLKCSVGKLIPALVRKDLSTRRGTSFLKNRQVDVRVHTAELADSCRYLVGSMPRVLETNAGIASFLHTAEHFGLGLDFDRRLPGLLERVTLDEVNETAATFLTPDRAAISVAGP